MAFEDRASVPADDPLEQWRGEFGDAYTDRNSDETATREAATIFDRILHASGIRGDVRSILEVGANVGINLIGLRRALGQDIILAAVEPNPRACARLCGPPLNLRVAVEATAHHLPFRDRTWDLVFTSGVLIHVRPEELGMAMREIVRVAGRYVLCSEYFADTLTEAPYRCRTGMMWKRDFGRAYLEHCQGLEVQQYGFLWQKEFPHFDNLNWWMFLKR